MLKKIVPFLFPFFNVTAHTTSPLTLSGNVRGDINWEVISNNTSSNVVLNNPDLNNQAISFYSNETVDFKISVENSGQFELSDVVSGSLNKNELKLFGQTRYLIKVVPKTSDSQFVKLTLKSI